MYIKQSWSVKQCRPSSSDAQVLRIIEHSKKSNCWMVQSKVLLLLGSAGSSLEMDVQHIYDDDTGDLNCYIAKIV